MISIAVGGRESRGSELLAYRALDPQENLASREAPMLAVRVARGELPPLDKRLPENPRVVSVIDRPGLYGGVWRKFDTTADFTAMRLLNNYFGLTRWKPDVSGIEPGLASSWEYDADGRGVTFRLRRGLKWSDGTPATSADILFWWALCEDKRVAISAPDWSYAGGETMRVSAPDAYTVRFEFSKPYVFMDLVMATGFWVPETIWTPAHYLRRFHPDHSKEHSDFAELLRKDNPFNNPDRPTLAPWKLVEFSPTGDRAVYERNPYFSAIDPAGRQLPYIDRIECIRVQSAEAGVLYAISGAVDAQFRQLDFRDYALLKRFEERGGYRLMTWEEGTAAWHAAFINWSVEDPKRRLLFRDPNFRCGLAYGVNRERLNQVVWGGSSRAQGAGITDESWHFNSARGETVRQRWIEQWSDFDPVRANALLDAAGLAERDAQGFRMYRGDPFVLRLDYFDLPYAGDVAELLDDDWTQLGLRIDARRSLSNDLWTRVTNGRFDIYLQHNSELDLFTFPGYVFPVTPFTWHPRVGRWVSTGGEEGEAPEGIMADLLNIWSRVQEETDIDRRHDLVLDAIEIQLEHGPFMIGTTGRQKTPVLVSEDLFNVPETGILGPWATCQPASLNPEQFFFSTQRLYDTAD